MDPNYAVRIGSLDLGDFSRYDRTFPHFGRPTELGSFSLDGKRNYFDDAHNMKHYIAPCSKKPNYDLSNGYDSATHRDFGKDEKLESMLQWIARHHEKILVQDGDQRRLAFDFVCYRGLLTTIACTPYEDKNGWIILATKIRGTIYLCAVDTDDDIKRMNSQTPREKIMSFWGYKFEQYVCADSPEEEPTPQLPLNVCEEYNIVCKTKLKEHRILYGAEIDCVDPETSKSTETDRYLELKTNRVLTNIRQEQNFYRYKCLKWWMQSFLVGISKIVCGFRDDAGFVNEIKVFATKDLPKLAKDKWTSSVCFNFCEDFLSFVKKHVEESQPNVTYRFRWQYGGNLICELLKAPEDKYKILPDWYISFLKKLN